MANPGTAAGKHFHPKGKLPSKYTIELRKGVSATLPFEDKRDFDEAKKGFIAEPPYKQIMADAGHVAWDMGSYQWLLQGKDFDSIHPSLQRQAILNMAFGLYEVVPDKIYQMRGFDLANISFIKGDTGWIVFDPLTAKETARAALEFINEKLGKRPVVGVVYSHSHVDHFGGVRGVVDEADVESGKVKVIAPEGFLNAAISENVFSGNAMSRRTQYQYAVLLPRDPHGHVDQSIGKNVAAGNVGLIKPNLLITKDFEEVTLDGVKMVFQNTPDTEAPVEMNTYFPQFKAFWAAENITGTIHNIYTLRGAPVRNALNWSKQINNALYKFGQEAEVMFASHSWPRWGNERIQEVMSTQRDTYANLNNQSLHYANQAAKDLLADVFEQIGYQKESPSLRNSFLQGSYELRTGLPGGVPVKSSGPDVIRAMSTENWLDFLGISVDPRKAEGIKFVINLVTPDNGEKYLVEMSNATLTNIKDQQAKSPDLTITVNRVDLNQVMIGASTFDDLIKDGKAKFEGDRKPFDQLRSLMVSFTPNFEILPGTAAKMPMPGPKPMEVPELLPPNSAGD